MHQRLTRQNIKIIGASTNKERTLPYDDLPARPSASDIIKRSIVCHPSLLREALIAQANEHDDYSLLTTNARASQGATASRAACLRAYDAVAEENIDAICADCGAMVITLNIACKLQCLPAHIRTQAAVDWQEAQ